MSKIVFEGSIHPENQKQYDLFEGYMEIKGLSHKTITKYRYDLAQWFKFLNSYQDDITYKEVTEDHIEEYLMICKKYGNSSGRLQFRCATISSFYKFLRKKKRVTENPMDIIDRPKKKLVRTKHFLKANQVESMKEKLYLLDNIVAETFVLLAINTAARRNALRHIRWEDINWEEREIFAIEKGPKEVTLLISKTMREQLLKLKEFYIKEGVLCEWVFLSKYQGKYRHAGESSPGDWVRKAGELIGVQRLTPHSLRRTAATLLYHNDVDVVHISKILNHENIATTQIYLQVNATKLKELKDNVNI